MFYCEVKGPSLDVTPSMEIGAPLVVTPKEVVEHFKKLFGDELLVVYDDDLQLFYEDRTA